MDSFFAHYKDQDWKRKEKKSFKKSVLDMEIMQVLGSAINTLKFKI